MAKLLNDYNWIIILLPLIIGIFSFRSFQKGTKYIFYFVLFGTVIEIVTRVGGSGWLKLWSNTMPIGHIYIPISFLLLAIFYWHLLEGFISKKLIVVTVILFEIFSIVNTLFIQDFYSYPSYSGSVGALILTIFSVLLFAKIMEEGKIKKLVDEPVIWFNSGILIYYTANFFFYILFNILLHRYVEFLIQTITIFKIFMTIFYILIAVGFWKARKNTDNYYLN